MRTALAIAVLFVAAGCARVPDVVRPGPGPVDSDGAGIDVQEPYRTLRLAHARLHREAAAKARRGEITTQAEESAFLDPAMTQARKDAFAPLAKAEQDALGDRRWTPERMIQFREALADALEAER